MAHMVLLIVKGVEQMSEFDEAPEPPAVLKQIEQMLGDNFKDYVLVAIDNDMEWIKFSSISSAYGVASRLKDDIKATWRQQRHECGE